MGWFAHDHEASWRRLDEIEQLALKLRRHAGYGDLEAIEIVSLLEKLGVTIAPTSDDNLGSAKALANTSQGDRIELSLPLYKAFLEGDPNARLEVGHEVGHLVLHYGASPRALATHGNNVVDFIPPHVSEEAQAWQYSRAWFMPRAMFGQGWSAGEIAERAGVPVSAVAERAKEIEGFERTQRARIQLAEAPRRLDPERTRREQAKRATVEKLAAWEACAKCHGKEPIAWRMARGFLIAWTHFKRDDSHYGWTVVRGQARALIDLQAD